MFLRLLCITLFIFCFNTLSTAQKHFEGKMVSTMTWENVPANMKAYVSTTTLVAYYKKDKSRTESSSTTYSAITIEDYTVGKRLMLMDMTIGAIKMKTATLSYISPPQMQKYIVERTEEYKTILGYTCQKLITTTAVNGTESKSICFVLNDYVSSSFFPAVGQVYIGLPMETEIETAMGTTRVITAALSEETVSDALFSMNIPAGYKLTDLTKQTAMPPPMHPTFITSKDQKTVTPVSAKKYDKLSDADLKKQLSEALAKEDFETAQSLKTEIDTRKKTSSGKYGQYSLTELTKMLNDAVAKEDFTTAQELKKEIDNRPK